MIDWFELARRRIMTRMQADVDGGDNLSHGDTVRTLRALCLLASNEKSHDDMIQQVFPTLGLLLTHLLGLLATLSGGKAASAASPSDGEVLLAQTVIRHSCVFPVFFSGRLPQSLGP
jgi:hypothetical protein